MCCSYWLLSPLCYSFDLIYITYKKKLIERYLNQSTINLSIATILMHSMLRSVFLEQKKRLAWKKNYRSFYSLHFFLISLTFLIIIIISYLHKYVVWFTIYMYKIQNIDDSRKMIIASGTLHDFHVKRKKNHNNSEFVSL